MCETSFINVTDMQMQYLALRLSGFDLVCWHGVPRIPREEMYFFFIFWRDIYQKTVRYPLSFPRSEGHQNDKKGSKKALKLVFFGNVWVFLAMGTWISILFWYYDLAEALE